MQHQRPLPHNRYPFKLGTHRGALTGRSPSRPVLFVFIAARAARGYNFVVGTGLLDNDSRHVISRRMFEAADDLYHLSGLESLTSVFFGLHIVGGHVGLPILVLTFLFSKKVSRHPTIVNFCVTWILYSVSFCLL